MRVSLCLAAALALTSPAASRAAGEDQRVVTVAVDRQAYLARDAQFRIDRIKSQIDATLGVPPGIDVTMDNLGVTVRVSHLAQNARFIDQVRQAFAGDAALAVSTRPAEVFHIGYSASGLARFGSSAAQGPATLPLNFASKPRDLAALDSFVRRLRPPLPGVTIESQPDGAIVRVDDPTAGADVLRAMRQEYGQFFEVTQPTDTSLRLTIAAKMAGYLGPGRSLLAAATLADVLRAELRDPLDLETQPTTDEVTASLIDPERHGAFTASVAKAFDADPDFVVTTEPSEVIRIARVATPADATPAAGPPDAIGPPQVVIDAQSKVEQLASPPVEVAESGGAVTVRARDPANNAERAAIVRQALSSTQGVVVTTEPDQSLSIRFVGASVFAAVADDRLERAVEARLSGAHVHSTGLKAIGAERLEVRFATEADAATFRRTLANRFGFAVRLVDDADAREAADAAPSPGDQRVPQTQGGDLWLRPDAVVSGEMIAAATPAFGPQGGHQPDVEFHLTEDGRQRFAAATGANVGRRFAIVLDGVVVEAPVILDPIVGGQGMISGAFTPQSAQALAQSMLAYKDDLPLTLAPAEGGAPPDRAPEQQ